MACETWAGKLDAYVDGELPTERGLPFDGHLRECPRCAATTLNRMQLKQAVHAAGQKFAPDPQFRARIQQQIATRHSLRWTKTWLPVFATAAVVLVAITVFVGRQKNSEQELIAELTDLHVATLASANPVDVVSSDRHNVKPWFEGKVPFTFNLPELQGSPFTLVGGRISYLHQSAGAELIFRVRQHQVSLFIFQETSELDRELGNGSLARQLSFNLETWDAGGRCYIAISDTDSEDNAKLVSLPKQARAKS